MYTVKCNKVLVQKIQISKVNKELKVETSVKPEWSE